MPPRLALRRVITAILASAFLLSLSSTSSLTLAISDEEVEKAVAQLEKQLKLKIDLVRWSDGPPVIMDAATGLLPDGSGEGDVTHMAYGVIELTKPTIKALEKRVRAKATRPIVGNETQLKPGQRVLVLVFFTADPLKPGAEVQAYLGFDGPDGVPVYPGGVPDPLAGNATFVQFGQYPQYDALVTSTTPLGGVVVGGTPEWNSADARLYGYNDGRVWVAVNPLPNEAETFDLRVRSVADSAQTLDLFTTSAGLSEFPLDGSPVPDDLCFSGLSYAEQAADGSHSGNIVEIALEPGASIGEGAFPSFGVTNLLTGESVDAPIRFFPETGTTFIDFPAAPGLYRLSADGVPTLDGTDNLSPSLFGDGVVVDLTGPRTGLFLGAAPCARLPQLPGGLPDDVLLAAGSAVGLELASLTLQGFTAPDGSDVGLLLVAGAQAPALAGVAGGRPASIDTFDLRAAASPCEQVPVDLGIAGIHEVCADGTSRLFWLAPFVDGEDPGDIGRLFTLEAQPSGFPDGVFPGDIDPLATAGGDVRPEFQSVIANLLTEYGHDFSDERWRETP
jgi:hypothetical protein